jgi:hypothetical protein
MGKKWYPAGLMEAFQSASEANYLLWINWILVRAGNAEEAYARALKFGEERNTEYPNTDGVLVTVSFRGLRDLYEIYEELEDGAEIIYDEYEDISSDDIDARARKKEDLAVFQPRGSNKDWD